MEFARNDKTYHFLRKRFTGFLSEADAFVRSLIHSGRQDGGPK